jgi:hypothetical protein
MMLTGMFQWGVRQSAEVESQMISVERVLEYARLEPEAPLESNPGKTWNKNGNDFQFYKIVIFTYTYAQGKVHQKTGQSTEK